MNNLSDKGRNESSRKQRYAERRNKNKTIISESTFLPLLKGTKGKMAFNTDALGW